MAETDPIEIPVVLKDALAEREAKQLSQNLKKGFDGAKKASDGLDQSLKKGAKSAKGFGSELVGGLTKTVDVAALAARAISAVTKAVRAGIRFAQDSLEVATENELVERRLNTALRIREQLTFDAADSLRAFNSALEQQTGFTQASLFALQGQLVAVGVLREDLEQATLATIGLAEATGKALQPTAIQIGRVIGGNTKILERAGFEFDNTAEAIRELAQFSELARDRARGLGGQIDLLTVNLENVQGVLGATAETNETLIESVSDLNEILLAVSRVGVPSFVGGMFDASVAVGQAVPIIGPIVGLIEDAAQALGDFADEARETRLAEEAIAARATARAKEIAAITEGREAVRGEADAIRARQLELEAEHQQELAMVRDAARRREAVAAARERERDLAAFQAAREAEFSEFLRLAEEQEAAEALRIEEGVQAIRDSKERELQAEIAGNELRFQEQLNDIKRREDAARSAQEQLAATFADATLLGELALAPRLFNKEDLTQLKAGADAASAIINTTSSAVASGVAAFASGEATLREALGSIVGGTISSLGIMLIQLGTAALAASALSLIPFFAGIVGPPGASAAAGALVLAAGAAMVAVGNALGGAIAGAGAEAGNAPTTGGSPAGAPDFGGFAADVPRGPGAGAGTLDDTRFRGVGTFGGARTVNINITDTIITDSQRQLGRVLSDAVNAHADLAVGG